MKLRRVVVGVNESPAAVHALRESALIASTAGAELVALRVVSDPWQRVEPGEVHDDRIHGPAPADLAEQRVLAELEALVSTTVGPGWVRCVARFGLPGIELARWSELLGADLLVLGRQPWGELARRPAGRTVTGTLARSRVPCLLVPFGQRRWNRVLGALGTGPAGAAVKEAATAFAQLWHTVPHCVHAETAGDAAHAFGAVQAFGGGVSFAPATIVSGDPVGEVLKAAREQQSDTLVIGYHRGETVAEAGRVAPQLLERAPCAVLTVPV